MSTDTKTTPGDNPEIPGIFIPSSWLEVPELRTSHYLLNSAAIFLLSQFVAFNGTRPAASRDVRMSVRGMARRLGMTEYAIRQAYTHLVTHRLIIPHNFLDVKPRQYDCKPRDFVGAVGNLDAIRDITQ